MDLTPTETRRALSKASRLIGELGRLLRKRTVLEADKNEQIQKIKDCFEPQTKELDEQIDLKVEELLGHALPHFVYLRYRKTKSIRTPNGTIEVRRNRTALDYDKADEQAIIRRILRKRLAGKLLRRGKYTINKEDAPNYAKDVAKIKGLSLVNRTTVTIKPSKVDVKPFKQDVDSVKVTLPEEED